MPLIEIDFVIAKINKYFDLTDSIKISTSEIESRDPYYAFRDDNDYEKSLNPTVSVIIPVYNEEKYISICLNTILSQDYPSDKFEVILIDGKSTDNTSSIAMHYMQHHSNIRLALNQSRRTSKALNIGISLASNDIIIRMDGHAEAPQNYISKCVRYLLLNKIDIIGCHAETIGKGFWGQRIAIALASKFGVGNANFRVNKKNKFGEPGWLGATWRKNLMQVGGYDESFKCNEDCELSYRMLYKGYSIYIPSDLSCKYFCRTSLLALWKQYFRFGFWKVALVIKLKKIPSIRHIIPVCFLSSILFFAIGDLFVPGISKYLGVIILCYFAFIAYGALSIYRQKKLPDVWSIIPVFVILHFSYGAGFFIGILYQITKRINIMISSNLKSA